jgi:hypothetical protein
MYLNHNAVLQCTHGGRVILFPAPKRSLQIMNSPVVTDVDLMQAIIVGCAQVSPATKPCTKIGAILMGRAVQIQVDGQIPILESLQALTDGGPPGFVSALTNGGSNATPIMPTPQSMAMIRAARSGAALCPI